MAEDGIPWLGEGGFDCVVFKYGGGALVGGMLVSAGGVGDGGDGVGI